MDTKNENTVQQCQIIMYVNQNKDKMGISFQNILDALKIAFEQFSAVYLKKKIFLYLNFSLENY